uniref:Uncharacterized protein n=1 Tax=Strongyloides venezuelensis TaxID=75913 RepID=A0A0K0F7X9_STRVS
MTVMCGLHGVYSFFGLKGAVSSCNCIQCERYAGRARKRVDVSSYDVSDEYNGKNINRNDAVDGPRLDEEIITFLKRSKVLLQEYYQLFSVNSACVLHISALKSVANLYKIIFTAKRETADELKNALTDLLNSYKAFEGFNYTPKTHFLINHAPSELQKNGKLGLFSEQELEPQHSLVKRDLRGF